MRRVPGMLPLVGTWLDTYGVHPSVDRMVQEYRPNLRVVRTLAGRYAVASPIKVVHNIPGNFGVMLDEWFPVLYVPQASEPDRRWIRELDANRWSNVKKPDEDARQMKLAEDFAEELADQLYPMLRRELGPYNMANVRAVNPYDRTKRLQDELGRELR